LFCEFFVSHSQFFQKFWFFRQGFWLHKNLGGV
jgi:hypothetical protein